MEASLSAGTTWLAAAAVAGGVSLVAGSLATRLRWIDRREGDQAQRKPRAVPVPLVGGAALLAGIAVASWLGGPDRTPLPWWALGAGFLLGLVDDLRPRGLSPAVKLAGQTVVAALLAFDPELAVGAGAAVTPGSRALVFAVALVAQNAMNTYDNADGAAASLALAGLFPFPVLRGALIGFLPFNLVPWRRSRADGGTPDNPDGPDEARAAEGAAERAPWAYLGDSGSHLLGVLVAAEPRAWPVLLLPVLDLGRVAHLRLSRGRRPWQGDRSHLAHRMAAGDWSAPMVAFTLAAVGSLPLLGALESPRGGLEGALACVLAFWVLVAGTPDPEV